MKRWLYIFAVYLMIAGCTNDPQLTDVGDPGLFVTDTIYTVQISNFVQNEDTIRTILHSYIILGKNPSFRSYPVFKIEANSDDFIGKYVTSLKILLTSAYYGGPEIDSLLLPVYPVTQHWLDSDEEIWQDLNSAVDFTEPIGFLKVTDSISNVDTLEITNIELFREWQDSITINNGFIVYVPDTVADIQKTYYSTNGISGPVIKYTYKDSANATEEKEGTVSFINDMYVFYDQTDQFFNNDNYYYLQTIRNTNLIIDVTLDSIKNVLDKTHGVLINARLFLPYEPSESFVQGSGMIKFGVYPLAEGWTPDSLAKNSNYVGTGRLVSFNMRENNYLTFSDAYSVKTFASSYIQNILNGALDNFGWLVQAYERFKGYEVYAIPKSGKKGMIVYTYWIPPEPRY